MENKEVIVSAPGKITLFGEHAVVYGEPAIVASIDKRVYVSIKLRNDNLIKISALDLQVPGIALTFEEDGEITLETDYGKVIKAVSYIKKAIELTSNYIGNHKGAHIIVKSTMPVGAGLGTSAAVAVATIKAYSLALGYNLNNKEVAKIGYTTEKEVQGSASPMDTSIATHGGLLLINPRSEEIISKINVKIDLPFVIGYVVREGLTAQLVAYVKEMRDKIPFIIDPIIKTIGDIVRKAEKAFYKNDLNEIGYLMNINHGLLDALGVSTKKLNDMVYAARSAGALGSKLTGAGGGGCIIALAPNKITEVSTAIKIVGGQVIETGLSYEGVRKEEGKKFI